jgi:capsular exopolysaccharide synthesis family protein
LNSRAPLEVVARRWPWIVATTLIGLLTALSYSLLSTDIYRASASVFFSLQYGDSASELVQGSTYTQNQVTSFARLATTPAVLLPVIEHLDLDMRPDDLAERIQASAPLDTVIIEIAVTDSSAARSAAVANAVADELSATVERLAPQNAAGNPTVQAMTVAVAEVPDEATSPNLPFDLLVGLVLGFVLGLGAAWARDVLDSRFQDQEGVATVTDLPVVGSIGTFPSGLGHPVVVESAPQSPYAEAFRRLRTNLQFLDVSQDAAEADRRVRTLLVTSSVPNEGKSTIAANIAATLAETGARILLMDTDLRRPTIASLLGIEGAAGLTTVLLGRASVDEVVQEWGSSGLQVLTSGELPPNPSELLGSPAMRRLMQSLRGDYDCVVLDAPPLLPVADSAILSHVVDGTFVVANVRRVRRRELRESLQTLDSVHARTLGLVLNQVRQDESAYGYARRDDEVALRSPIATAVAARLAVPAVVSRIPGRSAPAKTVRAAGKPPVALGSGRSSGPARGGAFGRSGPR